MLLPSGAAILSPDRHLMMKDVVRVIASLHLLQKWVKLPCAVVHLWPERIRKHVAVWIIDIATLVVFVGVRSARVLRLNFLRVNVRIELSHPLQTASVFLRPIPILLELDLHDRR